MVKPITVKDLPKTIETLIQNLGGIRRSNTSSLALLLGCQPTDVHRAIHQLVVANVLKETDGVITTV